MLEALASLDEYVRSPYILIADAHENLWKDKEFVIEALDIVGEGFSEDYLLRYVSYAFPNSYSFEVILEWMDLSLRGDEEIILKAFEWANEDENCDADILGYASEELTSNREFILEAIKWNSASALAFADKSLLSNKEVVLAAVQEDGKALSSVDETLKGDREVVLAAVQSVGWALRFADETLKADKEIALTAIQQDARALDEVDDSLKNDPEFMKEVEQYLTD